jgi:hypothetical protein
MESEAMAQLQQIEADAGDPQRVTVGYLRERGIFIGTQGMNINYGIILSHPRGALHSRRITPARFLKSILHHSTLDNTQKRQILSAYGQTEGAWGPGASETDGEQTSAPWFTELPPELQLRILEEAMPTRVIDASDQGQSLLPRGRADSRFYPSVPSLEPRHVTKKFQQALDKVPSTMETRLCRDRSHFVPDIPAPILQPRLLCHFTSKDIPLYWDMPRGGEAHRQKLYVTSGPTPSTADAIQAWNQSEKLVDGLPIYVQSKAIAIRTSIFSVSSLENILSFARPLYTEVEGGLEPRKGFRSTLKTIHFFSQDLATRVHVGPPPFRFLPALNLIDLYDDDGIADFCTFSTWFMSSDRARAAFVLCDHTLDIDFVRKAWERFSRPHIRWQWVNHMVEALPEGDEKELLQKEMLHPGTFDIEEDWVLVTWRDVDEIQNEKVQDRLAILPTFRPAIRTTVFFEA